MRWLAHTTASQIPMTRVLLLLLASALVSSAGEPLPEKLAGQNGLYRNYLPNFLQGGLIKSANETRLLTKLNESEQSNFSLLSYLGYVGKVNFQPFGSVQEPGQRPESSFADMGYPGVQMTRMSLRDYFEDGQQGLRIYVFSAFHGWPGINNTCVVLTTPEDHPLDWRGHYQTDVLESCAYDLATQKLSLVCKVRSGGKHTYEYKVRRSHAELTE